MDLLQIVPALPPALSGVGDYAMLLARELLARHGTGTRFIVGEPGWDAPTAVAPFPATAVASHSPAALRSLIDEAGTVLLHYVPYGYAHRGCPFWLVDAIERWKAAGAAPRRLLLLFHEVSASGPPWSSAFWTSPLQRWLAARLARAADARRITTSISRRELGRILGRTRDLPMTIAPVFSTLGEPLDAPPPAARERQVVVFGSRPVREDVYADTAALEAFCARQGIRRVVDVGNPVAGGARVGGGIEVHTAGPLPAAEASALFARSLAGYFRYPAPHLGKSTIFAAYCAHRMVPVTFPGNDGAEEGLRTGEHFLEATGDASSFGAVADAAHTWYRGHRLAVHADDIQRWLSRADDNVPPS